ncbi:diguanylate cyclase [Caloramator sp. E03]|uniref:HD domain-containing phosphohydrolase n=1 Tax=Caloramator sp. E03 TaxID=2576307 RepID=UPI001110B893|nr:HD domain-containing phosphohydrolase [Caloramator sp. E03]QCX34087.1 diguanylate cyclase [Caloramator sp. E03]
MKLRIKILLTLTALSLIFMFSFCIISYKYYIKNIKLYEKKILINKINQIIMSINFDVDDLEILAGDWAIWDDTYQYVKDKNKQYEEKNLDNATLNNLNIDIMLFYDNDNNLVNSKIKDDNDEFVSMSDEQIGYIKRYSNVLFKADNLSEGVSGIIVFNEKPMLISSRPITDSKKQLPKDGTLIVGRYIDSEMIDKMNKLTDSKIKLLPLSLSNISEYIRKDILREETVIDQIDKNNIAVYKKINDILNNPAFCIVLNQDRNYYIQQLHSLEFYMIFLSITFIVIILVLILFIDNNIIEPVENISKDVRNITFNDYEKGLLTEYKSIEFSSLVKDINGMLNRIFEYNKKVNENEKRLNMILNSSNSGYWDYDIEKNIFRISDNVYNMFGFETDDIFPVSFEEWRKRIHPQDYDYVYSSIKKMTLNQIYDSFLEYRILSKNGEYKWVYTQGKIVEYDNKGFPKRILGIIMDINDKKKMENEIKYLTYYDLLTGLFNRGYYDYIINKTAKNGKYPVSIIIADINGLKMINDNLGHEEGDKVIIEIASILKNTCPEEAVICRWGGDEFIAIIEDCNEKQADTISKNIINTAKNNLKEVTLSLGHSTQYAASKDLKILIRKAEEALYHNKLLNKQSLYNNTLLLLSRTLFEKSNETEEHADRILNFCEKIGYKLNLSSIMINELSLLAKLHDIGKIGIPDEILNKPGKLTDTEFEIMKTHTQIGYRIVSTVPDFQNIAYYILCHHERYDGKGYPNGLKGEEIPLLSRILSIVDAFDVMTHERSYKKAMPVKEAIDELRRCSSTQFDPQIVDLFIRIIEGTD